MSHRRRKQDNKTRTTFLVEEMEPRVLFSAGGVDVAGVGSPDRFAEVTNNIVLGEQSLAELTTPAKTSDRFVFSNEPQRKSASLATFSVDVFDDTVDTTPGDTIARDLNNKTSLRAAIMEANALGGSHRINLPPGTYNLSLDGAGEDSSFSGDLDLTADIIIVGAGAGLTIIDASAISSDRVLDIFGDTVSISGVTIRGGSDVSEGGGIRVSSASTLTLDKVDISKNEAVSGAGIHNSGMLTFSNGTVSDNGTTSANLGGGIFNAGGTLIQNSTISANSALASGGGIFHIPSASDNTDLVNVTVSDNFSSQGGGLSGAANVSVVNSTFTNNSANNGGGIAVNGAGSINLRNTIVAGNISTNPNVDVSGQFFSFGGNLIGDSSGSSGLIHGENNNQVGTSSSPVDPLINSALASNGGDTQTHALLADSPAINTGISDNAPAEDQRGVIRIAAPDVGAFEFSASMDTVVVNTVNDAVDGSTSSIGDLNTSPGADGVISLREAIIAANNTSNGATPDRIHFDITTPLQNSSDAHTIKVVTSELPAIIEAVVIDGTTEPDYAALGRPVIELDGDGGAASNSGLVLGADGITIRGLAINNFDNHGLKIDNSSNNFVESNYFGTDVTGTFLKQIGSDAIKIIEGSNNNIGGANVGNLIAGSNRSGVSVQGSTSTANRIQGNLIGTSATGQQAIGNSAHGIELNSGSPAFNQIGGTSPTLRNVISGNGGSGIHLGNSSSDTEIFGNFIGTTGDGLAALGNGGNGITLDGDTTFNFVGDSARVNSGNIIAHNGNAGVFLNGSTVNQNTIQQNSIHSNSGKAIDIESGANDSRLAPSIDAAAFTSGMLQLSVSHADAAAAGDTLRVEYFLNSESDNEGRTFIGAENIVASSSPAAFITQISTAVTSASYVTATVTDTAGNTSEFSNAQAVVITNTAPTLQSGTYSAGSTAEGTTTTGVQVSQIVSAGIATDADGDSLGLALRPLNGDGKLQFSLNSTTGSDGEWTSVSTLPANEYLLFSSDTWLRYEAAFSGAQTVNVEVRAWDGSSGIESAHNAQSSTDPGSGGGSSAFSANTAILQVTVTDANNPPTADAGSPVAIAEGDKLILDGQSSADSDGNILSWEWDINFDGSFDSDLSGQVISIDWPVLAQHGITTQGDYTIALRVTDNEGASTIVSYQQTISNTPPSLTITGSQSASVGAPYYLSLSSTDFGDNTVNAWHVDWGDGSTDTYNFSGGRVTHTYIEPNQQREIYVSATDADGVWYSADLVIANDGAFANLHRVDGSTATTVGSSNVALRNVGVAQSPDGLIYTSDPDSGSIYRYDPSNDTVLGEFISGSSSGLSLAAGIAFNLDGDLFVADQANNLIKRFDGTSGEIISTITAGASGLLSPVHLLIHDDGWLYVTSASDEILRFNPDTGEFGGAFVSSANNGGLDTPYQFEFGPNGDLYVSSALSNEVYRYNGNTGLPVSGNTPFIGASNSNLNTPTGLAFGPDDLLYVANIGDDLVHRYDSTSGALENLFVDGSELGVAAPRHILFIPDVQLEVHAVPVLGTTQALIGSSIDGLPVVVTYDDLLRTTAVSYENASISHFRVQAPAGGALRLGVSEETAAPYQAGSNNAIDTSVNAYWYPSETADGETTAFSAYAIDSAGRSSVEAFSAQIMVTPINNAPVFGLIDSEFSLSENIDTKQRLHITNLPILDDAHGINELYLSGRDAQMFTIDQGGLYLNQGVEIDFEANQQLQVSIRVDDPNIGTTYEDSIDLVLNIEDVNEAPSASIALIDLEENSDTREGLVAGTLAAMDPDQNETLTFSIAGGRDADKFTIQNNQQLILRDDFLDFERQSSYQVVVSLTDTAGLTFSLQVTIDVMDLDEVTPLLAEETAQELRDDAEAEASGNDADSITASTDEGVADANDEVAEAEVTASSEESDSATVDASEPSSGERLIGRSRGQVSDTEEPAEGTQVNLGPAKFVELHALARENGLGETKASIVIDLDAILELDSEQREILLGANIGDEFDRTGETTDYSMLDNSSFTGALDNLRQGLSDARAVEQMVIGSSATVTTGLSIGYVLWLVRGSVLLSTVLSSLPAWRLVDPLPVLGTMLAASNTEEDEESLESIIDDAEAAEDFETRDQESKQS